MKEFEKWSFSERLKSMFKVDFRRAFTMPLFYIMIGVCFVVPILILVMTSMMAGTVSIDPVTQEETVMEGFKNVWQAIGAVSSTSAEGAGMSMDLTSMCNINMLYFFIAVLVCVFIADDFRSGYAKNLFTVRSKKTDYVISKTLVGFVGAACMFLAYFIGAMVGGAVSSLPFSMEGFTVGNLIACMLSKIFLCCVFVAIYVLASVIAKQKLWLSLLLSFGIGMLFYTVAPMITPLDSGAMQVLLTLVGGGLFAFGLGAASNQVLKKTSLV